MVLGIDLADKAAEHVINKVTGPKFFRACVFRTKEFLHFVILAKRDVISYEARMLWSMADDVMAICDRDFMDTIPRKIDQFRLNPNKNVVDEVLEVQPICLEAMRTAVFGMIQNETYKGQELSLRWKQKYQMMSMFRKNEIYHRWWYRLVFYWTELRHKDRCGPFNREENQIYLYEEYRGRPDCPRDKKGDGDTYGCPSHGIRCALSVSGELVDGT